MKSTKQTSISSVFKPYLKPKTEYKGGKNAPAHIEEVVKLSSNENPLGASPKAVEAYQKAATGVQVYPDQTAVRLQEALEQSYEHKLPQSQFLCGNSGSELIDLILRGFVREEDEVIFSNPCFLPYAVFSRWYGAKLIDVPLRDPDYSLDVEGILSAVGPNTRVVFLTSPNNPTGTYIPKAQIDYLLEELPGDVLVVFDEVYWHFADADDYTTALPYVEQGYPVISINSFSKTFGLAGLRLGYAYTTDEIAAYLRQICKPFLVPGPSIAAGIAALEDEEFIAKTVQTVLQGRQQLELAFVELGIRFWPSQGNFFLIDPPLGEQELTDYLLEKGIMVRPVSAFGAPGKVRISVGTEAQNTRLIAALQEIIVG